MATVLLPLPALDFDPTEVSVSWAVLAGRGHQVVFATPEGRAAQADDMMISGQGLDPWGAVPLLRDVVVVGLALRANADARRAYSKLQRHAGFLSPVRWNGAADR
jgi:putative intracellular protease/amidase